MPSSPPKPSPDRRPPDAGQATLDYLAVVAVVALVLGVVTTVTAGPSIANGVGEAFRRALCRVTGDRCAAVERPVCTLRTTTTEASATVKVAIVKVGRTTMLLRSERSDGTVDLTLLDKVDGALVLSAGAGGRIAIGEHAVGVSAMAQASAVAHLGGGRLWRLPDARAADRLQRDIVEVLAGRVGNAAPLVGPALNLGQRLLGVGAGKRLPRPTWLIGSVRGGYKLEVDGPLGSDLELETGVTVGTIIDRKTGSRTVYLAPDGTVGATIARGMAGLEGTVDVRLALTLDRDRRPTTLVVSGTGQLDAARVRDTKVKGKTGRGGTVHALATLDLADPANAAAATRLLRALLPAGAPDRAAAAWALGRAFADHARIDVATYGRKSAKFGAGLEGSLGAGAGLDVGVSRIGTRLSGAWTRPAGGAWERRDDCLARV